MTMRTVTVCDGCGGEFDSPPPFTMMRSARESNQHFCRLKCVEAWAQREMKRPAAELKSKVWSGGPFDPFAEV